MEKSMFVLVFVGLLIMSGCATIRPHAKRKGFFEITMLAKGEIPGTYSVRSGSEKEGRYLSLHDESFDITLDRLKIFVIDKALEARYSHHSSLLIFWENQGNDWYGWSSKEVQWTVKTEEDLWADDSVKKEFELLRKAAREKEEK